MLKFQIDFPFRTNFRKIFQFHHFNVRRTFDFIQIQINSNDYHMLGNTQTKIKEHDEKTGEITGKTMM